MNKYPYFTFYPKDFAADDAVELMSTQAVGAYILLLCKSWHQDQPGTLPMDDRVLARWARLTPGTWKKIKPEVLAAFKIGDDGLYHQSRMEEEFKICVEKSQKASQSAKKRWGEKTAISDEEPRKSNATALRTHDSSNARASDSGSGSDSLNTNKQKKEEPPGFTRFWKSYPGKRAEKPRCLAIWTGSKPTASGERSDLEPMAERICEAIRQQDAAKAHVYDGKAMWPNSSTWLYNERWDDDIDHNKGGLPGGSPVILGSTER